MPADLRLPARVHRPLIGGSGRRRVYLRERRQQLAVFDLSGAVEMPLRTGFKTMQPARAAAQWRFDLDDMAIVGERSKPKPGYRRAIDGGHGGVEGRGEVHGRTVVDIVHNGTLHQRGTLEEAQLAGEVYDVVCCGHGHDAIAKL